MRITGNFADLGELTKGLKLAEPVLKRATVSAVNKSATSLRSFSAKEISLEYKITQKDVRAEININRANIHKLTAELYGKGKPGIPIFKFAPTPKRVPSTLRRGRRYLPKDGIKVMVRKGNRKVIRTAFIARMQSGHVGVFKRTGKAHLPIEEVFGPSVIRILDSDHYRQRIHDRAGELMEKNMAREADYYLKKYRVLPYA